MEFGQDVGDFDPLIYWQDLGIEALVLYGEDDTNIPTIKSEALLLSLNKPNITVKLYEGSGHNLETLSARATTFSARMGCMRL